MGNKINTIESLLQVAEHELSKSANISVDYENLRSEMLNKARQFKFEGVFDDEFIWDLWGKRTKNGIANINNTNISKNEFKKPDVRDILIDFTRKIMHHNTQSVHDEIVSNFERLKDEGVFQYVYSASIARVFCTFHPDEHMSWVTRENIKNIYLLFSNSFSDISKINFSSNDINWFEISYKLRQEINLINERLKKPLNMEMVRQIIVLYYNRNISKHDFPRSQDSNDTIADNEEDCMDSSSIKRKKVDLGEISFQHRKTMSLTIIASQKEKELTQRFIYWIERQNIYILKGLEQRTGANDRIDVSLQHGLSLIYAELKSVSSYSGMPKRAIRAALGQILDYQFYDRKEMAQELWIVLDNSELTKEDRSFITSLNTKFKDLNLKLLVEDRNSSFKVYK